MKLKWPGINAKDTVVINLGLETFDLAEAPVLIDNIYFTPKQELHVTLLGEKVASILKNKIRQDPETNVVLEHVFEDIDWSFKRSGPIHILSRRNKERTVQKTVILLIDMPGMTSFYEQLKSLGLIADKSPVPPAHVTLYTHHCPLGIGVPSKEILNSLIEKSFSVDEFNEILKQRR